jgi:hypothetical protein
MLTVVEEIDPAADFSTADGFLAAGACLETDAFPGAAFGRAAVFRFVVVVFVFRAAMQGC